MPRGKVIEYALAQSASTEHFDIAMQTMLKLTNGMIGMGYVPQGGIAHSALLVNGSILHVLVQAMVKYDTEANNG